MGRQVRCDVVIAGCQTVLRGDDDQEVVRLAAEHARDEHGISQIDDRTVVTIMAAIQDD
jgi:predicted small metal-binding protein